MNKTFVAFLMCFVLFGAAHADTKPAPRKENPALGPSFSGACWQGDLAAVQSLYAQGAPLEFAQPQSGTPLFMASSGHPDVVKFLLARGARVDTVDNQGDTPLSHACDTGDLESVKMLLAAGSDINHVDNMGWTPLMRAAFAGRDNIIPVLLSHHIDINFSDKDGPAIFQAVYSDHLSTAKLLFEAGAKPTLVKETRVPPHENPSTLASYAAGTNDPALLQLVLDHGAPINERNIHGITALLDMCTAGQYSNKEKSAATIQTLLKDGADPNLPDNYGYTPLMAAVDHWDAPTIAAILSAGAKPDAQDSDGWTALIHAARYLQDTDVKELLAVNADVNVADKSGETALTYAGSRGGVEIVALLKNAGAKRTDLHIIAQPSAQPPLSKAQLWALAVSAMYCLADGDNPQVLGGDDGFNRAQDMLKDGWDIQDKDSLVKELDDLRDSGHHSEYQKNGARLAQLGDSQFSQLVAAHTDQSTTIRAMRDSYVKWKDRSGLAWDMCRSANLVNCGFVCHYLTEQEAWDRLLSIARDAQSHFSSWQEMNDNFLDGRLIWANEPDPQFDACARLLLNPNDPNSPWNQLPWKTDLAGN